MDVLKQSAISKFRLLFSMCFVLLSFGTVFAQSIKVTGKVTDKNGEPLVGVAIVIEGTRVSVSTAIDGKYAIDVPTQSHLVFSMIGLETQTVPVNARAIVDVVMKEADLILNEVVVTALGITREKKALSYSVQEVQGGKLLENRAQSVANALAGKVAGLQISKTSQPGGSSRILVRGINSLGGNNLPLIVVDGIPYNNQQGATSSDMSWGGTDYGDGISNLNQDDVASISVLKGPSATALYGSRAGNGVLLITTKKGSTTGPRVSFTTNYTFDKLMIQPEYQNAYGQGSLGEYANNLRSSWGPKMQGQILRKNNATWAGILNNDDTIMPDWTGQSLPFSYYDNDMYNLLRTGSNWNNSLELNLGTGKTTVRAAVADTRTFGVVPHNELAKTAVTLRASGEVMKNLTFDTKFSYVYQKGKNRPTLAVDGYNPLYGYQYVPRSLHLQDFFPVLNPVTGKSRMFEAGTPTLAVNPYIATELKGNTDLTDRINGFASLTYKFTDWLSLMGRFGVDTYQSDIEVWYAKNGGLAAAATKDGRFTVTEDHFAEINSDFLLTAQKDHLFDSKFSGSLSFGGNIMDRNTRSLYSDAQGLNIDGLYTIANGITKSTSNYKSKKQTQSLYGFAQLSYDGWAYLDLTARNDWSSTLPPDNWSFFYPSAGLSIIVTEMLKKSNITLPSWFTFAKLRASIASAGNDTGPYNLHPVYSTIQNLPGGQNGVALPGALPNANLKPEIVTSSEIGLDIRFFNNRIGLDFTYYTKAAKNQIFNVATSMTSGYSSKWINAGRIDNTGYEVILNLVPVQTKDWNWNLSFNFAKNTSKVVELDGNSSYLMTTPGATQLDIKAIVGRPIGEMYTTTRQTTEGGRLLIDDSGAGTNANYGQPLVSAGRTQYVGNMNPDWIGGISSNLDWKGFYFNFLIDVRVGGSMYLNSMVRLNGNGATEETLLGRDSWYPFFEGYIKDKGYNPYTTVSATRYQDLYNAATTAQAGVYVEGVKNSDKTTTMGGYVNPQYYFGRYGQDHYVYDMTHVRLREVSLGYMFPEKWFKGTPVHGVKLSFVATNVCFLYNNLPGFDPESTYSSGNAQGVETASIPSTRSLGFNLNLTF